MSDEWPVSWEAHRRRQAKEVAAIPLAQQIRWLEDQLDFARSTGALKRACERRDRAVLELWND